MGTHLRRLWSQPGTIPVVIALAVIVAAWTFAERQSRVVSEQAMRTQVLDKVSVIRAKLEGDINANIQLVRGLVSVIKSEPDIDQEQFRRIAEALMHDENQLINIALAPDLVIRMVYPVAGNEAAIGLDYRTNDAQREAAFRARDTGQLILAGPVDLVQGGTGFVGRFPIFTGPSTDPDFWGIAAAVIDSEKLFAASGLTDPDLGLSIALSGRDGTLQRGARAENEVFYGDAAVFANDPVLVEVTLPSGSWRLAAVPKGGWAADAGSIWSLRFAILVAGTLLILPIYFTGRLASERQRHMQMLARREEQMRLLSERLELALAASEIGIWEYDLLTGKLVWDARMHELYDVDPGHAEDVAIWRDRLHPDDRDEAIRKLEKSIAGDGNYRAEFRIVTRSGEIRWIRAIGSIQTDEDGLRQLVGVNWNVSRDHALAADITRAKELAEARNFALEQAKARIEYNALHDSLTGLPNRRYLDRVLIGEAGPGDHPVVGAGVDDEERLALLHVDLDRFKQINDTLGHAAGDAMLIHAAKVLRDNASADAFVARIGGDEFVVFCVGRDEPALAELATRIVEAMRKPVAFEGHECRFGVSIGIAHGTCSDTRDPVLGKRLLVDADIALYRAKKRGRNRFEFFTQTLQAEIVETKRLADDILRGLENHEFEPFYQPQFDARSRDIVGVEALVRWRHPSLGLLTPDRFMRVAEELNVVTAIDRLVLEQGLRDHATWRAAGLDIPALSVNVSARRLHDEELIEQLRGMDIEPGIVAFELVESIFLDEEDEVAMANIGAIKKLGIAIEIDDFGTGYASIVSLMKVQPKRLKIDRQFIAPILDSPSQRKLVRSIVDIGASLGIGIVAEGVESMDHAKALERMGCDILQGYAFARPMTASTMAQFARGQQWRGERKMRPGERPKDVIARTSRAVGS